MGRA
jgi:hypothetical protein